VDFVVLHMLHDISKQVGLGRRTVCACFCRLLWLIWQTSHINQILHVGSYPGYLSWFWVSLKSVENVKAVKDRNFGLPIDLAHRLYNSLLLPHKPWGLFSRRVRAAMWSSFLINFSFKLSNRLILFRSIKPWVFLQHWGLVNNFVRFLIN